MRQRVHGTHSGCDVPALHHLRCRLGGHPEKIPSPSPVDEHGRHEVALFPGWYVCCGQGFMSPLKQKWPGGQSTQSPLAS